VKVQPDLGWLGANAATNGEAASKHRNVPAVFDKRIIDGWTQNAFTTNGTVSTSSNESHRVNVRGTMFSEKLSSKDDRLGNGGIMQVNSRERRIRVFCRTDTSSSNI